MTAPEPPAAVWAAALADGSGRHVPVRKHWPELAAALDAAVDGAVPDTGEMPTGQAFLDAFYTPSLLGTGTTPEPHA